MCNHLIIGNGGSGRTSLAKMLADPTAVIIPENWEEKHLLPPSDSWRYLSFYSTGVRNKQVVIDDIKIDDAQKFCRLLDECSSMILVANTLNDVPTFQPFQKIWVLYTTHTVRQSLKINGMAYYDPPYSGHVTSPDDCFRWRRFSFNSNSIEIDKVPAPYSHQLPMRYRSQA